MEDGEDHHETRREIERSRSRSNEDRDNDDDQIDHGNDRNHDDHDDDRENYPRRERIERDNNNEDVHNLYITNLSFNTTDESLRAAFEPYGEIQNCIIIKEPLTHTSRGFGFVSFVNVEDCDRALEAMNGGECDGRAIRAERARRNTGYTKTPGVYLGPPQLSSRFGDYKGKYHQESRPYYKDQRDSRGGSYDDHGYPPRGNNYQGGGGGRGYPRNDYPRNDYPRNDYPRNDRPPPYRGGDNRYPDRNGGGYDSYRGGGGSGPAPYRRPDHRDGYSSGGGGGYQGGGPSNYDNRRRSPPPMDDRHRGGPPPQYNGGGGGYSRGGGRY